jgi:hypothetical protein
MAHATKPRRTRIERGIYRQPNGKYAVCARRAGRLHFRTAGRDLGAARRAREELIAALAAGQVPASPRLRLDTVAARWSERFEAMVAAGERHPPAPMRPIASTSTTTCCRASATAGSLRWGSRTSPH